MGYYSQHEETMKTVIQTQVSCLLFTVYITYSLAHHFSTSPIIRVQASAGEESVRRVVTGAMVDCRRDSLWQKLLLDPDTATTLTHVEFLELISLVSIRAGNEHS